MAATLKRDQKQFDFVEPHVVVGKSRDVVRPNVLRHLDIRHLMPLGQSPNGCGGLVRMMHVKPFAYSGKGP